MNDMKQFTTAAKGRANDDDKVTLPFVHDGRTVTATKPKDGQMAMLMASMGGYSTENDMAKGTIDFFIGMFEDVDDKRYWAGRLLDSADDFDLEDLEEILYWVVGEMAERPTKPSPGSTSAQVQSGDGSTGTAALAASTSSPSIPVTPAT